MARIVLHIGTHKTATTTIQNVFHRNATLLAQHGIVYPRLGTAAGHHGLAADGYKDLPAHLRYPGGSLKMWHEIASRHADSDATVFLSSETLSIGHPNGAPDYGAIRAALAPFEEIRVLCLLREQWRFMQSVYLEIARKAVPPAPKQMVARALEGQYCAGMWVDYLKFHDRLLEHFAPEEIRFEDYAGARQSDGGILGRLLHLMECDLSAGDLDMGGKAHANASPPSLPTWAAVMVSQPDPAPGWLIKEASAAFAAEFGAESQPCLFRRDELEALNACFGPINATLEERLAQVQPGFTLSRSTPEEIERLIFRNRIGGPFWLRLSRRLARRAGSTES